MQSLYYIAPKDVSGLVGQMISLIDLRGERREFKIKSICYSNESDLYQGQTEENFAFSLSRAKMEQKFPKMSEFKLFENLD
jgi:hypothetical protein